jgi:hypothetical protein
VNASQMSNMSTGSPRRPARNRGTARTRLPAVDSWPTAADVYSPRSVNGPRAGNPLDQVAFSHHLPESPVQFDMRDINDFSGVVGEGCWIGGCVALAIALCYTAPEYGCSPVPFFSLCFYILSGVARSCVRGMASNIRRRST